MTTLPISRLLRAMGLVSALFAAATSVAQAAKKPAKPAAVPVTASTTSAPLSIQPMAYRERTLSNGLQVITVEDHSSPTVSVQVWYHVGSKNDPEGRSGFAHLFEHLMFKSTRYLKSEQFDRMTEDVGGSNNASTHDDFTNYFEVVPSNYLETLLWAEAERMTHLDVNEANFKSERAVVEEEYRQRILAQPYGRFFNAVRRLSFQVHPYKRPGIGSIEELEAASLDDVVSFYKTFYRPDDATLIVAGDFDAKQLDAWVDQYFGPLTHPDAPIPRVHAVEPPWSADRQYTETAPNVPLPAVALAWLGPPAASPDSTVMSIVSTLLSGGESSRLNQALVYRQQIATSAGISADDRVDPGLIVAYAIAAGGKPLKQISQALLDEIRALADKPPTIAELDKVKTQILTSALNERQTPLGKGSAFGEAVLLEGSAARVNTDLTDLQAVTPADVQRVVRKYLIAPHKVTIEYVQSAAAAPAGAQQ